MRAKNKSRADYEVARAKDRTKAEYEASVGRAIWFDEREYKDAQRRIAAWEEWRQRRRNIAQEAADVSRRQRASSFPVQSIPAPAAPQEFASGVGKGKKKKGQSKKHGIKDLWERTAMPMAGTARAVAEPPKRAQGSEGQKPKKQKPWILQRRFEVAKIRKASGPVRVFTAAERKQLLDTMSNNRRAT